MRPRRQTRRSRRRGGAAAVELALMLPVLCYTCVATIDFARLFFAWTTLATCAFNGAYYMTGDDQAQATWSSVQAAAQDDADNLSPTPTVASATGTDGSGTAYVEVTVTYTFKTLFNYPGIATSTTISRTLRMAVSPS